MTDRYERWNKWAPQFIADLIHDFGFTPEQAAGFVGNFAAESAYFNDIVEDGAIARGWKGGTGFAQWTAERRDYFEEWLKKKGWKADSYEGNYSYLARELKGWEHRADHRYVVPLVKAAHSIDGTPEGIAANAAYRVAKYFERPKVINTGPRAKAAKEALALYRKNPVSPTVWPTDIKEPVMPVPSTDSGNIVVMPAEPAKPVLQSIVMQGAIGGIVTAIYAIVQAYDPAVSFKQQPTAFWTAVAGLLTAAWTAYGRLASNAQPITLTQAGADKIAAERKIGEVPVAPSAPAAPVISPVPIAQQPVAQPLEAMPLNQLVNELPQVLNLIGTIFPQVAVIAKMAEGISHLGDANAPKWPPSTQPRP